jgi:hypothetical protein
MFDAVVAGQSWHWEVLLRALLIRNGQILSLDQLTRELCQFLQETQKYILNDRLDELSLMHGRQYETTRAHVF